MHSNARFLDVKVLPVGYVFGLPMGELCTLAISSFWSLMPLGMVNIKIKSRVVAEPLSTLLNRVVTLPHGVHVIGGAGAGKPHRPLS